MAGTLRARRGSKKRREDVRRRSEVPAFVDLGLVWRGSCTRSTGAKEVASDASRPRTCRSSEEELGVEMKEREKTVAG